MKIGKFDLNKDGTYIIAELSANHGGKIEIAKDTIKAAKDIGANAIKLQTYTADTITLDCDKDDFIIKGGTLWDDRKLHDLYKEAYLPWEWHKELFEYARSIDIDIFSSPFDKTAVDFLEELGIDTYKLASHSATNIELLEYLAKTGKQTIMSTGMADKSDIDTAISAAKSKGATDISLFQCTSVYPTPFEEVNLLAIGWLKRKYNIPVGLSDHSDGIDAVFLSIAAGATLIEKHFSLDTGREGFDHKVSLDEKNLKKMVERIRLAEIMMGIGEKAISKTIDETRGKFLRYIVATQPITIGEKFTNENIGVKRTFPGCIGIEPRRIHEILGVASDMAYDTDDIIILNV